MKKTNFGTIVLFLFYLATFAFFLQNSFDHLDPDLGWHLKVGQEMLATKQVPNLEHFNYTLEGARWVDHEWLSNIIAYLIFKNFGYILLSALFALITTIVFAILNSYIKKYFSRSSSYVFVLLPLEIFGWFAIAPHAGVRMQELSWLFLLLLLIIINYFERYKNKKILLLTIPLLYFWACLHGSFPISLVILGSWLVIKTAEKLLKPIKDLSFIDLKEFNWGEIKYFAIISFLAGISTFFTPYGLELYKFLFDYKNSFYLLHVMEWMPVWNYPFQTLQIIYLALTLACLLIYFTNNRLAKKNSKVSLWQLGLFFIFLLLSFKSRRHFPLFFIASLPLIIEILSAQIDFKNIKSVINHRLVRFYVIVGFLLVIFGLLIKTNFTNEPFSNKKFCQDYPCAGINFLKNSRYKDDKIFNNYNWGGFMIWTWPEKKIFIDGRLPQYPFNNHTILEEYYEFYEKGKSENKLNEYQIEIIILNKPSPKIIKFWEKWLGIKEEEINRNNGLEDYLKKTNNWKAIYQDEATNIYKKQ